MLNSYKKYSELRDLHNMTDYAVAQKSGVSTATLTNWKKGNYRPKYEKLKAIADLFGVSVEYFLE